MTEVGMALSNPLRGERRPGFVGQPLPGVSVRLVDGELQLQRAWSVLGVLEAAGHHARGVRRMDGSGPATSPSSKTAPIDCSGDRTSTSSRAAATRFPRWKSRKFCEPIPRSANARSSASRIWSGASASAARSSCDQEAASSCTIFGSGPEPGWPLTKFPKDLDLRAAPPQKCHGKSRQT